MWLLCHPSTVKIIPTPLLVDMENGAEAWNPTTALVLHRAQVLPLSSLATGAKEEVASSTRWVLRKGFSTIRIRGCFKMTLYDPRTLITLTCVAFFQDTIISEEEPNIPVFAY